MKVKLIIISIVLLLVMVFACGCIPFMEKLGLVSPTNEEQLSPEKGGPPEGLIKVLIRFKEKPGAAQQAMVRGVGGKIKYTYNLIPVIAAAVPEASIAGLKANPNVTYLEMDGLVYALDDELDNSWGVKRIGAGFVHDGGNKGEGIKVAVIDTGIDKDHPDLDDNLVDGVNFVSKPPWKDPDPNKWDDDNGHGTHVAGIIAAEDNDTGVVGVAPKAALYALKVLDRTGSGYVGDVIAAIDWSADNGIQVINMSLGGAANDSLGDACDAADNAGLLLVAAAGNESGGSVIYPAAYESVIAVSATDSADKLASFSNVGDEVELAAPGVYIYSTYKDGGYATYSGTSMASPHVAGVVALVIKAGTSLDVRTQLQTTAYDLGDPGKDDMYGYGLVDADEAVDVSLDTENIDGTVKDEDSVAVEGATVIVEGTGLSATTNAEGYYLLENVPVGDQEVTASAEGYYSETATVTIVKDDTVTQNFVLQAIPTYTVSGKVTDTEGPALEGATVTIEETEQSATTGNDGTYAISDVEGGTYNITAVKEGYSSQTKTAVPVKADTTVDFALEEITEELQKLHVNSIDMWYRPAGPNRFVSTKVEIFSSDSATVSGATVYLETTLPDGFTVVSGSGDTADDGTITFETKSRQIGTYTSTVTNVIKDGWKYESSANEKTSDSIEVP